TRNVLETIQEILAINKNDETAWQKLTFEKLTTLEIDKSVKLEILINSKTNDLLSKAEERVKVIKKFITDISLSTVRTEFHYYNSLKEELARGDGGFDI
ncbi:4661_t:CDS:1, partial [Funneliformis geosporum]